MTQRQILTENAYRWKIEFSTENFHRSMNNWDWEKIEQDLAETDE